MKKKNVNYTELIRCKKCGKYYLPRDIIKKENGETICVFCFSDENHTIIF